MPTPVALEFGTPAVRLMFGLSLMFLDKESEPVEFAVSLDGFAT